MQTSTYEVLEKIGKLRRTKEKVDALRANDSYVIRVILQGVFDESVKWLLPEGDPPYTPNELVDQEGILINEARKILYFVEGFHDLPTVKREQMFIELLEQVDPKDATLLCAVKEKKLPFKGITVQHVKEAFPGMIQDG
mgnify:FL=1|jgi:hypothetical protein|tara:strand:- start:322 stop:738 length:417 start_codon:yes stop_codon:yes gene_type:complete